MPISILVFVNFISVHNSTLRVQLPPTLRSSERNRSIQRANRIAAEPVPTAIALAMMVNISVLADLT
jgi:hypothetical protein